MRTIATLRGRGGYLNKLIWRGIRDFPGLPGFAETLKIASVWENAPEAFTGQPLRHSASSGKSQNIVIPPSGPGAPGSAFLHPRSTRHGSKTMTTQTRTMSGFIGYLSILAIFAGIVGPALI